MRLTILMPVYNASPFLAEAIESVLCQTHRDFELLILNDGSTDGSLAIMERYALQDERIRILSHPNCGMGDTLNRGLREATTEWVARMDADDIMLPHRLARQWVFIQENPEVKVVSCLARYINPQGKAMGKTVGDLFTRERFQWYVEHDEPIGLLHPGVMMHRPTILTAGGYRGQFWPADDIDLWNRLAEQGHLILMQDEILMKYRMHGGSVITTSFMQGRLAYEWVRACMLARRTGMDEPSWKTFIHQWQQAPWWIRLNRSRKHYAKAFYRKAGYYRMIGKSGQAVCTVILAALLQPAYTLNRLKRQIMV